MDVAKGRTLGQTQSQIIMISAKKIIVEIDGRAVYSSKSYKNARKVAWRLIHTPANRYKEVIVQNFGIIMGI